MNYYGNYVMPPREAINKAFMNGQRGIPDTIYANPWLAKAFVYGLRKSTGYKYWIVSVVECAKGIYYGAEKIGE